MTTHPRFLQGHPHHDRGEQKADGTSGRDSPDLNPRLSDEATPLRLNVLPTERKVPSFLEVECTKASDSAGGRTSPRRHDAPEAGSPCGGDLPAHMCGVGEGALPPGPNALIPQWEGASSPIVEQTTDRDLSRGTERDDDPDEYKHAEARDTARVVIFDAPIGSATDTPTMDDTDEQQWKQRLHTECAKLRRENNVDINPAKLCAISKQLYGSQVKQVLREADKDNAINILLRDVTAAATKSIQAAQHARYIPSPPSPTALEFNGKRIDSGSNWNSNQHLCAGIKISPKTLTPHMTSGAQQQTASQIVKTRNPINTSKKPKYLGKGDN